MTFKNLNVRTRTVLIIQSVGMIMGSYTHLDWVLKNGFMSDKYNAPVFSQLFWDSLTFLDPLAALLLIVKPKTGIYLTLAIISFDIIHNNLFYMEELYLNAPKIDVWIIKYWMILGQIIFGVFVVSAFKNNIIEIKRVLNKAPR